MSSHKGVYQQYPLKKVKLQVFYNYSLAQKNYEKTLGTVSC